MGAPNLNCHPQMCNSPRPTTATFQEDGSSHGIWIDRPAVASKVQQVAGNAKGKSLGRVTFRMPRPGRGLGGRDGPKLNQAPTDLVRRDDEQVGFFLGGGNEGRQLHVTYLSCAFAASAGFPATAVWDDPPAGDEPTATCGNCCLKLARRSSPGFCELVL